MPASMMGGNQISETPCGAKIAHTTKNSNAFNVSGRYMWVRRVRNMATVQNVCNVDFVSNNYVFLYTRSLKATPITLDFSHDVVHVKRTRFRLQIECFRRGSRGGGARLLFFLVLLFVVRTLFKFLFPLFFSACRFGCFFGAVKRFGQN